MERMSRMIALSVFRPAARRTDLNALIPLLEPAPVSEKPVGLNRCHVRFQASRTWNSARPLFPVAPSVAGMRGGGRALSDG
jgi:hypothetical protein